MKKINKKEAAPKIDFADAEFKSFRLDKNKSLYVFLNSWEEKLLTLIFTKPIKFSYKLGDTVQDLYEILDTTPFLENIFNKHLKNISESNFKLFQILDIYDLPFIEVVAESVEVLKNNC